MDHITLQERLEAAKRRAKLGQRQIDQQRLEVARLFSLGEDTTEAENRLRVYEKLQQRYLADVERIREALAMTPSYTGEGWSAMREVFTPARGRKASSRSVR